MNFTLTIAVKPAAILVLILSTLAPTTLLAELTDAVPGIGGDTLSYVPIGGVTEVLPMRMQQVYEARAFEHSMPEGGWITGVWFVTDEDATTRGWGVSLDGFEMSLGLTSRGADGLSPEFSQNFSIVPTQVLPNRPILIGAAGPGAVVKINFVNPFLYDPADGNLLLEIKNLGWQLDPILIGGPLDAWNVTGDAVSRVYARGDANATVGTVDTVGLTALFEFIPVPEPATSVLLAFGAGALVWHSWIRRCDCGNRSL